MIEFQRWSLSLNEVDVVDGLDSVIQDRTALQGRLVVEENIVSILVAVDVKDRARVWSNTSTFEDQLELIVVPCLFETVDVTAFKSNYVALLAIKAHGSDLFW